GEVYRAVRSRRSLKNAQRNGDNGASGENGLERSAVGITHADLDATTRPEHVGDDRPGSDLARSRHFGAERVDQPIVAREQVVAHLTTAAAGPAFRARQPAGSDPVDPGGVETLDVAPDHLVSRRIEGLLIEPFADGDIS